MLLNATVNRRIRSDEYSDPDRRGRKGDAGARRSGES
jgi:hypothetical protein